MIRWEDYCVANPDALETPAMLLFEEIINHNIESVCSLVDGGENLMAHVKTHKSEAIVRKQVARGIAGFKCATLKELDMVLRAGAKQAILAYPQCQHLKIERLCDLTSANPDAWISAIASSRFHVDILTAVVERRNQALNVMLDLDTGMHRTGIGFGEDAAALYRKIHEHPLLQAAGFHLYDGHDNFSDVTQREAIAQGHIEELLAFRDQVEASGIPVPRLVAGGSWSFPYYARTEGIFGSPGTFVYWDAGYSADMPDMPFCCAALVLTQVVDRFPDSGSITTDLGCKGISSDLSVEERAQLIGYPDAVLISQSEEHGCFRMQGELPQVGDYLLAVPGHICPTTIRYPGSHVVNAAGDVIDYYEHTARDRQ